MTWKDQNILSVISGKIALNSYDQFKSGMNDLPDEILVVDEDSIDKESKILVVITLKKNAGSSF